MKNIEEFKPGIYRHYKGGQYVALALARHHEAGEPMVVYVCCERGTVSVREWDSPGKDSWCDILKSVPVGPMGSSPKDMPRFEYVGPSVMP
jgi:hypothetical protein